MIGPTWFDVLPLAIYFVLSVICLAWCNALVKAEMQKQEKRARVAWIGYFLTIIVMTLVVIASLSIAPHVWNRDSMLLQPGRTISLIQEFSCFLFLVLVAGSNVLHLREVMRTQVQKYQPQSKIPLMNNTLRLTVLFLSFMTCNVVLLSVSSSMRSRGQIQWWHEQHFRSQVGSKET